jgi:hypothetical protein
MWHMRGHGASKMAEKPRMRRKHVAPGVSLGSGERENGAVKRRQERQKVVSPVS